MSMLEAAGIIVGLLVVAILFGKFRSTGKQSRGATDSVASPAKQYQGVEIVPGAGSCKAALELRGKRFLARRPPQLPLPDCSTSSCRCTFKKVDDRREDDRRWSDVGTTGSLMYQAEERRKRSDRRAGK